MLSITGQISSHTPGDPWHKPYRFDWGPFGAAYLFRGPLTLEQAIEAQREHILDLAYELGDVQRSELGFQLAHAAQRPAHQAERDADLPGTVTAVYDLACRIATADTELDWLLDRKVEARKGKRPCGGVS